MITSLLRSSSLVLIAALINLVSALGPAIPLAAPLPPLYPIQNGSVSTATNGSGVFMQLLDHSNPSLGKFQQRYWWVTDSYAGPGAPVTLFTPGETDASQYTGYLSPLGLPGAMATAVGGAAIMLEHRYWGGSSPYQQLTTKNLRYLTLQNSIADLAYFARNVELPFDTSGKTNAPNAPWVLMGGSYSGALAAWTESVSPGTFWSYTSSSAPTEAIYDFWSYFTPIQQGMAQNCSTDVELVINYVDSILQGHNTTAKNLLKSQFGLSGLTDSDFASALQNGPWLWQENQFFTGYSQFFQWCDWVENAVDISGGQGPPSKILPSNPNGVGLTNALNGYAAWINYELIPGSCASYGVSDWSSNRSLGCFNTYNSTSPQFTDMSVENPFIRQWYWMLCNSPFAWWQDGTPSNSGIPSIVSRLVNGAYWQRQCGLYFPTQKDSSGTYTYGSNKGLTEGSTNVYTQGWDDTNSTKLLYVTGGSDPWRSAGVSSDFRPGGPMASSSSAPIFEIPGGFHCSDLVIENAVNAGCAQVQAQEIAQIVQWVREYYVEVRT